MGIVEYFQLITKPPTKQRDIFPVLDRLLGYLYISGKHKHLMHDVRSIRESACFCPPEGMYLQWQRLAEALEATFPNPNAPIASRIRNIVMGG